MAHTFGPFAGLSAAQVVHGHLCVCEPSGGSAFDGALVLTAFAAADFANRADCRPYSDSKELQFFQAGGEDSMFQKVMWTLSSNHGPQHMIARASVYTREITVVACAGSGKLDQSMTNSDQQSASPASGDESKKAIQKEMPRYSYFRDVASQLPIAGFEARLKEREALLFTGHAFGSAVAEAAVMLLIRTSEHARRAVNEGRLMFIGFGSPPVSPPYAWDDVAGHFKASSSIVNRTFHFFLPPGGALPSSASLVDSQNGDMPMGAAPTEEDDAKLRKFVGCGSFYMANRGEEPLRSFRTRVECVQDVSSANDTRVLEPCSVICREWKSLDLNDDNPKTEAEETVLKAVWRLCDDVDGHSLDEYLDLVTRIVSRGGTDTVPTKRDPLRRLPSSAKVCDLFPVAGDLNLQPEWLDDDCDDTRVTLRLAINDPPPDGHHFFMGNTVQLKGAHDTTSGQPLLGQRAEQSTQFYDIDVDCNRLPPMLLRGCATVLIVPRYVGQDRIKCATRRLAPKTWVARGFEFTFATTLLSSIALRGFYPAIVLNAVTVFAPRAVISDGGQVCTIPHRRVVVGSMVVSLILIFATAVVNIASFNSEVMLQKYRENTDAFEAAGIYLLTRDEWWYVLLSLAPNVVNVVLWWLYERLFRIGINPPRHHQREPVTVPMVVLWAAGCGVTAVLHPAYMYLPLFLLYVALIGVCMVSDERNSIITTLAKASTVITASSVVLTGFVQNPATAITVREVGLINWERAARDGHGLLVARNVGQFFLLYWTVYISRMLHGGWHTHSGDSESHGGELAARFLGAYPWLRRTPLAQLALRLVIWYRAVWLLPCFAVVCVVGPTLLTLILLCIVFVGCLSSAPFREPLAFRLYGFCSVIALGAYVGNVLDDPPYIVRLLLANPQRDGVVTPLLVQVTVNGLVAVSWLLYREKRDAIGKDQDSRRAKLAAVRAALGDTEYNKIATGNLTDAQRAQDLLGNHIYGYNAVEDSDFAPVWAFLTNTAVQPAEKQHPETSQDVEMSPVSSSAHARDNNGDNGVTTDLEERLLSPSDRNPCSNYEHEHNTPADTPDGHHALHVPADASQRDSTSANEGELRYMLLMATIKLHKLQMADGMTVIRRFLKYVIMTNTRALTYIGMLVMATSPTELDLLHVVLLAMLVVFACSKHNAEKGWTGFLIYTMCLSGFVFMLYAIESQGFRTVFGFIPQNVRGIIGIARPRSRWLLLGYCVLIFAAAAERAMARDRKFSLRRWLLGREVRALGKLQLSRKLRAFGALISLLTVIICRVVFERQSLIMLGFVLHLLVSCLVVTFSTDFERRLRHLLAAGVIYGTICLTAHTLYQFVELQESIDSAMGLDTSTGQCRTMCPRDIGLRRPDNGEPLTFVLLPSILTVSLMGGLYVALNKVAKKADSRSLTSKPARRFLGAIQRALNFSKARLSHIMPSLVWLCLCAGASIHASPLSSFYVLCFIFNFRGRVPLFYSVVHLVLLYVCSFVFVTDGLSGDQLQTFQYAGIVTTGDQDHHEELVLGPVIVFVAALVHLNSQKVAEPAANEDPEGDSASAGGPQQSAGGPQQSAGGPQQSAAAAPAPEAPTAAAPATVASAAAAPAAATPAAATPAAAPVPAAQGGDAAATATSPVSSSPKERQPRRSLLFKTLATVSQVPRLLSYEGLLLMHIIGATISVRRAAGFVHVAFLAGIAMLRRRRVTTEGAVIYVLLVLEVTLTALTYFMTLNVPPQNLKGPEPYVPRDQMSEWSLYCGFFAPTVDSLWFFLAAVGVRFIDAGQQHESMRGDEAAKCARRGGEGYRCMYDFLAATGHTFEIANTQDGHTVESTKTAVQQLDAKEFSMIGNPSRIERSAVRVMCIISLPGVLTFINGALHLSILNTLLCMLSLLMMVWSERIMLNSTSLWPKFEKIFLVFQLLIVSCNLPPVARAIVEEGTFVDTFATLSEASVIALMLRVAMLWSVYLQRHVFDSFYFAAILREYHEAQDERQKRQISLQALLEKHKQSEESELHRRKTDREDRICKMKKDIAVKHETADVGHMSGQQPAHSEPEDPDSAAQSKPVDPYAQEFADWKRAVFNRSPTPPSDEREERTTTKQASHQPSDGASTNSTEVASDTKGKLFEKLGELTLWLAWRSPLREAPTGLATVKGPIRRFFKALVSFLSIHTAQLCYVSFTLTFVVSGTLYDAVPSIGCLAYALVIYPWAPQGFWTGCLVYSAFGIVAKSTVPLIHLRTPLDEQELRLLSLFLYSVRETSLTWTIFINLMADFINFGLVLLHLHACRYRGMYAPKSTINREGVIDSVAKQIGRGVDLYTVGALFESLALVILTLFYYAIVGQQWGSVLDSVRSNLLPGPLVVAMLGSIILMSIDRALYITASHKIKFAMHCLLVVGLWIGYALWRQVPNTSTAAGVAYFVVKVLYTFTSASQLRYGYPKLRDHDPFKNSPSFPFDVLYAAYRAVPFLWELRVLLDWTCSKTTLDFSYWLKLEDIIHETYTRRVDEAGLLPAGTAIPWTTKVKKGGAIYICLILLLFFPLFLYSTFNPTLESNFLTNVEVTGRFETLSEWFGVGLLSSYDTGPRWLRWMNHARPGIGGTLQGTGKTSQLVGMPHCSAESWDISPSAAGALSHAFNATYNNETDLDIVLNFVFTRQYLTQDSKKAQKITKRVPLPWSDARELGEFVSGNVDHVRVEVPNLYVPFVRNMPDAVEFYNEAPTSLSASCALNFSVIYDSVIQSKLRYTCLECTPLFLGGNRPVESYAGWDCLEYGVDCEDYRAAMLKQPPSEAMYFFVVSDMVPDSAGIIPNLGILAFYTSVILVIGRVLRSALGGTAGMIPIKDMQDPQIVDYLIEAIQHYQAEGDEEDLVEEGRLYFVLIDLLRSSDELLQFTLKREQVYLEKRRKLKKE